jgi:tetratricopeptide (TPR) repeat protein
MSLLLFASVVLTLSSWTRVEDIRPGRLKAYQESSRLYEAGRYDRALVAAKEVLGGAEKAFDPDHPITAMCLHHVALVYSGLRQYAQEEPYFKRALSIVEKIHGPDALEVA